MADQVKYNDVMSFRIQCVLTKKFAFVELTLFFPEILTKV